MRSPQKRGRHETFKVKRGSHVITVCGLYYATLYLHFSVSLNLSERMGTDNLLNTGASSTKCHLDWKLLKLSLLDFLFCLI